MIRDTHHLYPSLYAYFLQFILTSKEQIYIMYNPSIIVVID